jgi:hypothetical protein
MLDMDLKILFAPIHPFVGHPELAIFMAAGFAVLTVVSVLHAGKFRPASHIVMLLAAICWVVFSLIESYFMTIRGAIRIDLLLSYPLLLIITAAAVWLGIRGFGEGLGSETPEAK